MIYLLTYIICNYCSVAKWNYYLSWISWSLLSVIVTFESKEFTMLSYKYRQVPTRTQFSLNNSFLNKGLQDSSGPTLQIALTVFFVK